VLALTVETSPVPTLFFGLGERGKRAEQVADEAVAQTVAYLAARQPVDAHSADQVILPLVLAKGSSVMHVAEITQHLLTNLAVIRRFVDRELACEGEEGKPGVVRIR